MKSLSLILFLLPCLALANDWSALQEDGAIAVMRHALAPGTGDPSEFRLEDCSTQRNLDERGREQARKIGEAIRERGIAFDTVFSSQWCRTRETAELLDVGPVVEAPSLNSFFRDYSTRDSQTRATLDLIEGTEGKLMLVSHQVNISALAGQATRSGEILIFRLRDGALAVTGRILVEP
ncbi:histidine phosphatase family protein [Aliiruegeria lutimaris]|uniref:Histidine phosphatase superfamily (Branch 1) n=1 Tax=Aliiruegeria lutimaris TaxID=571298 RepID=A0A1G8WC12_9RHOB|nr:histidine phosphatase family protein [Aliiruegeria lutimaris]SDJ75773.1 Histidine phosphatase superfamily (branch 1) [Aliiruegeria lutimaris]